MAHSPESITQSEPSRTALATSEASALVGLGALIIDSSIWVAVTTGLAERVAFIVELCLTTGAVTLPLVREFWRKRENAAWRWLNDSVLPA